MGEMTSSVYLSLLVKTKTNIMMREMKRLGLLRSQCMRAA